MNQEHKNRFGRLITGCCMVAVLTACGGGSGQTQGADSSQKSGAAQEDRNEKTQDASTSAAIETEPEEGAPVLQEVDGTLIAELPDYGRLYLQSVTLENDITQCGTIYLDPDRNSALEVEAKPCMKLQATLVNDVNSSGEYFGELLKNVLFFDTEQQCVFSCSFAWGWDDGTYLQNAGLSTYKTKLQAGPVESEVTGPAMGESKTLSILLYDVAGMYPFGVMDPFGHAAFELTEQSIFRISLYGNTLRIRPHGGGAFDCESVSEFMEVNDLQKVMDVYNAWKETDHQAGVTKDPYAPDTYQPFRYTEDGKLKSVMFDWKTTQDTGDAPHEEAWQQLQTMIPLLIKNSTTAETVLSFIEQCIKEKSVQYPGAEIDFLYADDYYIAWRSEYAYGSSDKSVTHKFLIYPFSLCEEERAGMQ